MSEFENELRREAIEAGRIEDPIIGESRRRTQENIWKILEERGMGNSIRDLLSDVGNMTWGEAGYGIAVWRNSLLFPASENQLMYTWACGRRKVMQDDSHRTSGSYFQPSRTEISMSSYWLGFGEKKLVKTPDDGGFWHDSRKHAEVGRVGIYVSVVMHSGEEDLKKSLTWAHTNSYKMLYDSGGLTEDNLKDAVKKSFVKGPLTEYYDNPTFQ